MTTVRIDDSQLQRKIAQWSAITGRTIKDETRTAFKGMVKDAVNYTPPGSQGNTGTRAKRFGELAIGRDLWRMGFRPKEIKGQKVYDAKGFWGHKLNKPLVIKTKLNPKFSDPEAFRKSRLAHKHGGTVTQGGKQAFYIDKKLFTPMRNRLILEVGRLASGWVRAANELGVPVPAWISRHAETFNRGSPVIVTETKNRITMKVVNRFPDGTEQAGIVGDMLRRIEAFRGYAVGRLQREIDHNLKSGFRSVR